MSNRKYKSTYQNTINFIYESTAKRLTDRTNELRMKKSDLIIDNLNTQYDLSMISKILNNKKTSNNPYLIPPTYIDLLIKNLKYKNVRELLWDKPEENITYVRTILFMLIEEIINKHPEYSERLSLPLREDVSYVKYEMLSIFSWYYNRLEETASDEIEMEDKLDEISQMYHASIKRFSVLYGFDYIFLDHLIKNNGLSRLDKCIDNFVDNILIPLLCNINFDSTSFGNQAYNLIIGCDAQLNRFEDFYASRTLDPEADAVAYCDTVDIPNELKEACRTYVDFLEKAQNTLYDNLSVSAINDKKLYKEYVQIVEKTFKDSVGAINFIDEIQGHII